MTGTRTLLALALFASLPSCEQAVTVIDGQKVVALAKKHLNDEYGIEATGLSIRVGREKHDWLVTFDPSTPGNPGSGGPIIVKVSGSGRNVMIVQASQ